MLPVWIMNEPAEIIKAFSSVSLAEMDRVKLLNRVDLKFPFRSSLLPEVLAELNSGYMVLDIGGVRLNRYETQYYDTDGLSLYIMHHNGRLNRFKVRTRKYVETGQVYFEIKFKNNKARTLKERIILNGNEAESEEMKRNYMLGKTPLDPALMRPSIAVMYTRMTFVNHGFTERITIDTDIRFRKGETERSLPGVVIAEVKQERSKSSIFNALMHKSHVESLSVSKYCLGVILLNDKVRYNRFKPKLIQLNKICHENSEKKPDLFPLSVPAHSG
jgi:hypothetical protein